MELGYSGDEGGLPCKGFGGLRQRNKFDIQISEATVVVRILVNQKGAAW